MTIASDTSRYTAGRVAADFIKANPGLASPGLKAVAKDDPETEDETLKPWEKRYGKMKKDNDGND